MTVYIFPVTIKQEFTFFFENSQNTTSYKNIFDIFNIMSSVAYNTLLLPVIEASKATKNPPFC